MSRLLHVPEAIRQLLSDALLDVNDLGEFLRHAKPEGDPAKPGFARCKGVLPVRRALDPETSQLRQVDVLLRDTGDGWEVIALSGLDREPL
jgi:hypothetical protein